MKYLNVLWIIVFRGLRAASGCRDKTSTISNTSYDNTDTDADVSHQLMFIRMIEEERFWINEIENGTPNYTSLNKPSQLFVTTVRSRTVYSQTRNRPISGFATDIERTCVNEFEIPSDPAGSDKLLSLYFYTPCPFTLMSEPADWGGMVYPKTTWGTHNEVCNAA